MDDRHLAFIVLILTILAIAVGVWGGLTAPQEIEIPAEVEILPSAKPLEMYFDPQCSKPVDRVNLGTIPPTPGEQSIYLKNASDRELQVVDVGLRKWSGEWEWRIKDLEGKPKLSISPQEVVELEMLFSPGADMPPRGYRFTLVIIFSESPANKQPANNPV